MSFAAADEIRALFSRALSKMFREEVPAYGTLVDLVFDINQRKLKQDAKLRAMLEVNEGVNRISDERHGAIRLGTAKELFNMRRLFQVMDMRPVGYYDLSVAGIPVHSTAFRPISAEALAVNPFRVFTSLLRIDLIKNEELAKSAKNALAKRQIFSATCLDLIDKCEREGGLSAEDADRFVRESIETFRWHESASVEYSFFQSLLKSHRITADIVGFRGPHINHLTPRTLDIDQAQSLMSDRGIAPKAVIEGPPQRKCPILLRQTAFKALSEPVWFISESGKKINDHHTARFGEIEERGAALTPKGRRFYDQLLDQVRAKVTPYLDGSNAQAYEITLREVFAEFPDNWDILRREELVYFKYSRHAHRSNSRDLEVLIEVGDVVYSPIIYEDFLPVSAAGIFRSNLGDKEEGAFESTSNFDKFCQELGAVPADPFEIYESIQRKSLAECFSESH